MAYDKIVDSAKLDAGMTATASAIRAKTGGTGAIPWKETTGFAEAVAGITSGGAAVAVSVPMKDVNFYDYDGTRLYSYTVAEAAALTELPPLPFHSGLICQGWNWTLDAVKSMGRAVDIGAMYITDDGKTRIYITLTEGRTSPMMGVCPNGTVTVDWGDGSTPDVLTGTSVTATVWTPTHDYASPGDYVITLTVDGSMCFVGSPAANAHSTILRYSSGVDARNLAYLNSIKKIELGEGITQIGNFMLHKCTSLQSVTMPRGITKFGAGVCMYCYALMFMALPVDVVSLTMSTFLQCYNMVAISLSPNTTTLGASVFRGFARVSSIVLPMGVQEIPSSMCEECTGLTSIIIPGGVTEVGNGAFMNCSSIKYCDFTRLTSVPELLSINVLEGIPSDCEIRVPAVLVDEWKAATNWSTYADYIVGV